MIGANTIANFHANTEVNLTKQLVSVVVASICLTAAYAFGQSVNFEDQVQEVYIAYYGRPGDPGGIGFWAGRLAEDSEGISAIVDSFGNSAEFDDRFSSLGPTDLVNNIYQQLFGRDADPEGLDFFVDRLDSGVSTLASIALNIADGVREGTTDASIVANKLEVANAFTSAIETQEVAYGADQIEPAKGLLDAVDGTDESLNAGLANVQLVIDSFTDVADGLFAERTVYTNATDGLLYGFTSTSGETADYIGRRDENGIPELLTGLQYTDADGRVFELGLNELGLPAEVADDVGSVLRLDYSFAAESLAIHAQGIAANSQRSIESVTATFTSSDGDDVSSVNTRLSLDTPTIVDIDEALAELGEQDPIGNIRVSVSKCDVPVNASGAVVVNVRGVNSSFLRRYPAEALPGQPGQYIANIPQRQEDPIPAAAEQVCSAFADKLNTFCTGFGFSPGLNPGGDVLTNPAFQAAFCAELGLAVSVVATPVAGASAGGGCLALLGGSTIACNTLGFTGSVAPDATNVAQALCGKVEAGFNAVDAALSLDRVVVQAVADFNEGAAFVAEGSTAGIVVTAEQEVSAFGPFPELVINDLEPTVDTLVTSPAFPSAISGYTTSADLSCVAGADLTLSVVRDGVDISGEFKTSTSNGNDISTGVPPLAQGASVPIQDTIIVSAANPATSLSTSRTRVVAFDDEEVPEPPVSTDSFDYAAVTDVVLNVTDLLIDGTQFNSNDNENPQQAATRQVTFSSAGNEVTNVGSACFPLADPNPGDIAGGVFSQLNSSDNSAVPPTTTFGQIGGNISGDCRNLTDVVLQLFTESESSDIDSGEFFTATFAELPFSNYLGSNDPGAASGIVFELSGSAVCSALSMGTISWITENEDTEFEGETARCQSSTSLTITMTRGS